MATNIQRIAFSVPVGATALTFIGPSNADRWSVVWDGEVYVIRDRINGNAIEAEVHPHNVAYRVRADEKAK
ncbi:MAG: hypothetical protein IPK60_21155 [Sandaracinaceae bacterium]|nr:hypothetical protein [Sandaracinaceae bacterium]